MTIDSKLFDRIRIQPRHYREPESAVPDCAWEGCGQPGIYKAPKGHRFEGGLQLLGGIFIALIYGGIGGMMLASSRRDDEQMMGGIFLVLAVVVGVLMLLFGGLYLFGGFKLLKEKKIGRTLGIIGSILALLSFPLGTAMGVYGLWFLFGDIGKNFYDGVETAGPQYQPPPPPNSWQ